MKKNKIPKIHQKILSWMLSYHDSRHLIGAIEYDYIGIINKYGKFRAFLWICLQIFLSTPSFLMSKFIRNRIMYKNYLKIAFRNIKLHKSFSFINITGLAVGFTCCLIIMLFVRDELSYDTFHTNADRIYRLKLIFGGNNPHANSSMAMGRALLDNFGEIEDLIRISPMNAVIEYNNKRIEETSLAVVDKGFFNVFSFKLIKGDKDTALEEPFMVVISEDVVKRYFADEDPIGKSFKMNDSNMKLTVTGIMENMPINTHFHFEYLISGDTASKVFGQAVMNNMGEHKPFIYMLLPKKYDPKKMEAQFPDFSEKTFGPGASNSVKNVFTECKRYPPHFAYTQRT